MPLPTLNYQSILTQWPLTATANYCVGLSGGVDSVVLLHLLHEARQQHTFNLSALHVHHGLSPNADDWAAFCQQLCDKWQIPLEIAKIQVVKIGGLGLEESARRQRYRQFITRNSSTIVLAHHQDDQIETMLSQLLRGSDLHNIAAMQPLTTKSIASQHLQLWRPLLNLSKQQILDYAQAHQLKHIEDESNSDNQYLRNLLRNQILPQLTSFDPAIKTKLGQALTQIQQQVALIDEIAAADLQLCQINQWQLKRAQFALLSKNRQLNLLGFWLKQQQLSLPSMRQIREFNRQLAAARADRKPSLKLNARASLVATTQLISIHTIETSS